jgi:NADPH-dependent 2,4-dienoyl-CoA reductase/sulfur reductase-like enzyme
MTVYYLNGHKKVDPGSQSEAPGYSIPQHTTWKDPNNRRLRVITIGAGFSGILMAYQMQKECQNMEHVVYEKNCDIGGQSDVLRFEPSNSRYRHMADEPLSKRWL